MRAATLAYVSGLAAGAALLYLAGFVDVRAERYATVNDLAGIWAGPRAILSGADPYDAATWRATALRFQDQVPETAVYGYPAHVALALLPLGALPLAAASLLWTVGGMALAALAVGALLRAYVPALPAVHALTGFALFASQPAIVSFYNGQWSFLLCAALAAAVLGLRRADARVAGVAFAAVALAKPQLVVASAVLLARIALRRGTGGAVLWCVIACAALVALSLVLFPGWPALYAREVLAARMPASPRATALPTALHDIFGAAGLVAGAILVVAVVLVALAFDPRGDAALAVALAAGVVAAPYTWSYDQLVLLVPLVVAAGVLAARSRMRALVAAAGGVALLTIGALVLHGVYADARANESFNGLVPAALTGLVTVLLWPERGRDTTLPPM